MREIKFRTWRERTREMCDMAETIARYTADTLFNRAEEFGLTIEQFTGLRDENGREIYENDIVVKDGYLWFYEGKPNYRGTVEWIYSQWQAVAHCVNPNARGIADGNNEGLNFDGFEDGELTEWEVIGNIHENPELLK